MEKNKSFLNHRRIGIFKMLKLFLLSGFISHSPTVFLSIFVFFQFCSLSPSHFLSLTLNSFSAKSPLYSAKDLTHSTSTHPHYAQPTVSSLCHGAFVPNP